MTTHGRSRPSRALRSPSAAMTSRMAAQIFSRHSGLRCHNQPSPAPQRVPFHPACHQRVRLTSPWKTASRS